VTAADPPSTAAAQQRSSTAAATHGHGHALILTARRDDGSILASAYMLAGLLDALTRLLDEDKP